MKVKKDVETMQKIVKEYNCNSFIIGVPIRQANYLSVIRISKDMLIRYADKYLEIAKGILFKRTVKGNPQRVTGCSR